MPLAGLDPAAALIIADVQFGTLPNARAVAADQLVDRVAALAAAFRPTGRLVVFAVSPGKRQAAPSTAPASGRGLRASAT